MRWRKKMIETITGSATIEYFPVPTEMGGWYVASFIFLLWVVTLYLLTVKCVHNRSMAKFEGIRR